MKNNLSQSDRAFIRLWWLIAIGGGLFFAVTLILNLPRITADIGGWIVSNQTNGIPTPAPTRAVVTTNLRLRELWRKAPIYGWGGHAESSQLLVATTNSVFVMANQPNTSMTTLLALDAKSGNQRWATQQRYVDSIAVGPDALYAAGFSIWAYDIKTGAQKWRSNQNPMEFRGGYKIYFVDSQLQLFTRGPDKFRFIDIDSGNVSPAVDLEALVALDGQDRYLCNDKKLQLQDSATLRVRWTVSISRINDCYPLRTGNVVLISTVRAENRRWHSVLAVDHDSGRTLWTCQDCFASDVAVAGGWLYAITKEGSLVRYDVSTGKLLGTVELSSGAKIDPNSLSYAIAAAGGRVFVYFGDSQELIAFGP